MSDHSRHNKYDPRCDICVAQDAANNAWADNRRLATRNERLEAVLAVLKKVQEAKCVPSWLIAPVRDAIRLCDSQEDGKGEGG